MRIACLLFTVFFNALLFAQKSKLVLPVGHTSVVTECNFSPDGKYLITGSSDNTACIWNVETGQMLHHLKGHGNRIIEAGFSADGTKIFTLSFNGSVRVWNALTGDSLWMFESQITNTKNLFASFSPNSNLLLMNLNDTLAQIMDLKTGNQIKVFRKNGSNIEDGRFSPDGTKIITRSGNNKARIWEVQNESIIHTLDLDSRDYFKFIRYSSDGKTILSNTRKDSVIIWDAESGERKKSFHQTTEIRTTGFSPDGSWMLSLLPDTRIKLLDLSNRTDSFFLDPKSKLTRIVISSNNKKLAAFSRSNNQVLVYDLERRVLQNSFIVEFTVNGQLCFSPDGNHLITTNEREINYWDLTKDNEQEAVLIKGLYVSDHPFLFTKDGKHLFSNSEQRGVEIWEVSTGKPLITNKYLRDEVMDALSGTGPQGIYTTTKDDTLVWDALYEKPLFSVPDSIALKLDLFFSKDRSLAISAYNDDDTAAIWELSTGTIRRYLPLKYSKFEKALFTSDNRYLITLKKSGNDVVETWNTLTGDTVHLLGNKRDVIKNFALSDSGYKVALGSPKGIISVWDAAKGKEIWSKKFDEFSTSNFLEFSPDNQWLLAGSSGGGILRVINAHTGEEMWKDQNIDPGYIRPSVFSPDGKEFYCFTNKNIFQKRELRSGNTLLKIDVGNYKLEDYNYRTNRLLVSNNSGEKKLIDLSTEKDLYSFYAIDSSEYLVKDSYGRYDGTKKARSLLYLICGLEVIGLEQVKDQLWVPNLAKRIMNNDSIQAPRLSDLNICNYAPIVEFKEATQEIYRFIITPNKGGLGKTYLSVNGIEMMEFDPDDLIPDGNRYLLEVGRSVFMESQSGTSTLSVKAMTADNLVSSSEAVVRKESGNTSAAPPNLYAVFIGVSEYKAKSLNLQFAAKDADNLGEVFTAAARKYLNTTSGGEHVFLYKLNTGNKRTGYPDKATIQNTLKEIGGKAKPNDILVIFFAGHGKMLAENQQFYFLTADTDSNTVESIMRGGISMDTLTSWVNPKNIKAQQRILIFDACNSGQAINNFIVNGATDPGNTTTSAELESKQVKAIEKLYERSNFFILSASASDQSAYEYEALANGLLTYSLLNSIKINGAIFNRENLIDVDRWFSASNEYLTELVKQFNLQQQPQQLGNNTNTFGIGKVDQDVKNMVKLPSIKPVFGKSNFINTAIQHDDLNMEEGVYNEFNNRSSSSAGTQSLISFDKGFKGKDVFFLTCNYKIANDIINVDVILFKEGKKVKDYNVAGKELKDVSREIVEKAIRFATGL
jgi:WD40 repeat protein/uncharacterized caspase-like protein